MTGQRLIMALAGLLAATPCAVAQSSASFTVSESVFNNGGSPTGGQSGSSASFRLSHDAIGDAALGEALASPSYRVDGGFVTAWAPPGEVADVTFADATRLAWTGSRSAVSWNVYRDLLSGLSGGSYGTCLQQGVVTAAYVDAGVPPVSNGYFYLVTGVGRLGEEGTKGSASDGVERLGHACP